MQVRSQRDRLHSDLEENKKFIEVLKLNYDKEREKREAIDVEFSNTKECVKRLNKNVKELENIWNDTKLSMEKLFLIAEVCSSCSYIFIKPIYVYVTTNILKLLCWKVDILNQSIANISFSYFI